jgi:type I restriction enzyme M protein
MFVQSIKFIEAHHGNTRNVAIYGQEYTNTTYKLAKMNLAIRGISGNLGEKAADTFGDDQHKDLKADYIMANPPFNQKDWRAENELKDDPRWRGYDVPPKSNANYAWILNMVSKLSENGVAGFILANGALSGGGEEYKIRRTLIENNLVEAIMVLPQDMFYTTNISVTIWILNRNKKEQVRNIGDETRHYRNREKEILFMDLRQIGEPFEKKFIQFSMDDIRKVANTYHGWQKQANLQGFENLEGLVYKNIPEYCYSATFEEVAKKDFSLVPSKYIEFVNRDENIDFDDKMQILQTEFAKLLKAEEQSKTDLLNVFKELGYEIGNY